MQQIVFPLQVKVLIRIIRIIKNVLSCESPRLVIFVHESSMALLGHEIGFDLLLSVKLN